MTRRGWLAVAVMMLWVVGLGLLMRREFLRPDSERFAEAGLRVVPGATFFGVMREGAHIGFASSTIDTMPTGIRVVDYLVADLPVGGRIHRASARTTVELTRGLRLREFHVQLEAEQGPVVASGRMEGDSTMAVVLRSGTNTKPDTQRIRVPGPVLLPNVVPLAVALGERPEVGRTITLPVFDPIGMAAKQVTLRIDAESLFVVTDSSIFDPRSRRWRVARPDTVRAWHLTSSDASQFNGWVDAHGLVVRATHLGTLTLDRLPYEVAFENWRAEKRDGGVGATVAADDDILESTAIAAEVRVRRAVESLDLRLRGVDLAGFDLSSPRQSLRGDTLRVRRETEALLTPAYQLGSLTRQMPPEQRVVWQQVLRAEPLIETMDPDVRALATRIRGGVRDPREVAERINRWVYDSLAKRITFGIPSARAVLEARAGDCNEHTQLYVALARAASLPARVAAGLVYLNGKFYYHAWPEVYLGNWVAVDPTLGQFPADAAHLRFVVGGLGRQAELLRLIGNLDIDVLSAR